MRYFIALFFHDAATAPAFAPSRDSARASPVVITPASTASTVSGHLRRLYNPSVLPRDSWLAKHPIAFGVLFGFGSGALFCDLIVSRCIPTRSCMGRAQRYLGWAWGCGPSGARCHNCAGWSNSPSRGSTDSQPPYNDSDAGQQGGLNSEVAVAPDHSSLIFSVNCFLVLSDCPRGLVSLPSTLVLIAASALTLRTRPQASPSVSSEDASGLG